MPKLQKQYNAGKLRHLGPFGVENCDFYDNEKEIFWHLLVSTPSQLTRERNGLLERNGFFSLIEQEKLPGKQEVD